MAPPLAAEQAEKVVVPVIERESVEESVAESAAPLADESERWSKVQSVMEREALPPLTAVLTCMSGAVVEMTPAELGLTETVVSVKEPVKDTLNKVYPIVAAVSPEKETLENVRGMPVTENRTVRPATAVNDLMGVIEVSDGETRTDPAPVNVVVASSLGCDVPTR